MNKETFLAGLRQQLAGLPLEEREELPDLNEFAAPDLRPEAYAARRCSIASCRAFLRDGSLGVK